jgi:hypothetical protein
MGLMHAPPAFYFSINEIVLMFCADFNSLFDISDTFILALYTDEFIIVGSPKQFMMLCEKILTSEDGKMGKGGWSVAAAMFLVQKVFTLSILKSHVSSSSLVVNCLTKLLIEWIFCV